MSKSRAKSKRRRRGAAGAGSAAGATPGAGTRGGGRRATQPAARSSRLDVRDDVARPDPIWSPFPLTEIGMAVGVAIFVAGLASDGRSASRLLSIAVLVLVVVVGELCLREHFAGFRSHTLLLAVGPVTIAHVLVVVAVTDVWRGPLALVGDLAFAAALALSLHARFRVAHERARAPR